MKHSDTHVPKSVLYGFQIVLFFLAFCFFAMGLTMVLFPQVLTRAAGEPHAVILGMLRGAGGSIIPYSFMYVWVAVQPFEGRRFAFVIACANALAIILDFTSVLLKEYQVSHAMIDAPLELLSVLVIVVFYSMPSVKRLIKDRSIKA
jgi:hypothetical protein